ncbi:MAG: DUF368 domain-containing protein [Bacteroidota bacterium]
MRGPKDYFFLFLKGLAMGSADIVPGVSGGTIAFITGIYEELINSIKDINLNTFKLLFRLKLKDFFAAINWRFLVPVFVGILVSLFSLVRLVTFLLKEHPILIWSFFFGLIIISAIIVLREVRKWHIGVVLMIVLGAAIAYGITILSPSDTPNNLVFVFFSGALAICAMILPGISGAFILLILGKYEYITQSLSDFIKSVLELDFNAVFAKLGVILTFVLGCLVGLLSFSRLISFILKKYHDLTVALLSGFMIGSLNKVWPWKEVTDFRIDSHGNQVPKFDRSVSPNDYLEITGNDPQVLQALLLASFGIVMVLAIDRIAAYGRIKKHQ